MQTTLTFDPADKDDVARAHRTIGLIIADVFGDDAPADTAADKSMADAADKKAPAKKAPAKKAPAKKEEAKKEEPPADEPSVTRDDVRAKLKEYAALEGKEAAIGILKDHGAASIGELDEGEFAAVVAACDA